MIFTACFGIFAQESTAGKSQKENLRLLRSHSNNGKSCRVAKKPILKRKHP